MITQQNIVRHELIGLEVKVSKGNDFKCVGISGQIIDETKNMILIISGQKRIWVVKDKITLDITIPSGDVVRVSGNRLFGRPEERIRKKFPAKWKSDLD